MSVSASSQPDRLLLRQVVLTGAQPVDLTVAAGDIVAISGWAGSDLLWAIAGLRPLTTGLILVDGRQIKSPEQAQAAGVALVPQGNALASMLTAFENVLLPLAERLAGPGQPGVSPRIPADDPTVVALRALQAVGLSDSADHLVEELSGGQQQRVAVARAIALQPRLLLADQATTDLDPGNRGRVIDLLREMAASGAAVLLASDDPAVSASCDRTVSLEPHRS